MDYVTQHFIAAAKKLREELRDIAGKLFLLHEDIQEQTEAINKANETQAKRNESTPILRAELHIPDAVQAQKETSDRKKHSLDLFMTVVQTITMVAVGAILFRGMVALALRAGLNPIDLKLATAAFVLGALALPKLRYSRGSFGVAQ